MSTNGFGMSDSEWLQARDEATAVLGDVSGWTLSAASWDQVRGAIEEIRAAMAADSPDELWRSAGDLELYSPMRVLTRLGDRPALPVPADIRERIVELIDALTLAGEPADVTDRKQDVS